MMNLEDTIAAISTPPGEGGIGIVRLSGKDAITIASKIFFSPKGKTPDRIKSPSILYGHIINPDNRTVIDEVLLTIMRAPNSYTREDTIEINCHGGTIPLRKTLELTIKEGARLAEPGEFTFRAFMNGRIDLSQAEATIDLIRAKTEKSSRIALEQLSGCLSERITSLKDTLFEVCTHIEAYIDFPEEDIDIRTGKELLKKITDVSFRLKQLSSTYDEARFFREGLAVAIIGKPNVGKSSLLNALLARDRAIVTELPGTTRDIIEEYININGLPIRIMDTAGISEAHNLAESEGVKRSLQTIEGADLILSMFDISIPLRDEDFQIIEKIKNRKCIIILNKSDLPKRLEEKALPDNLVKTKISVKTGEGIELLKKEIESKVLRDGIFTEGVVVTNLRHKLAIDRATESLLRASQALEKTMPYEIIAFELRDALDRLGEVVGAVTTEDILNRIFSEFCIGK